MSLDIDIQKHFRGFTLDVRFRSPGGTLGILGASGSGKSMTLKCIAGLETPDRGHVIVNGRVLFDAEKNINLKPRARKVGYLFQNYALFPHMTVIRNIACALPKTASKEKKAAAQELLARFRLSELAQRYPAQLSGGQQQRAALARILACQPELLLLDEPFSALDAHLKDSLRRQLGKLLADDARDAILVTHSREEVFQLSRRLLILSEGQGVVLGDTPALFRQPQQVTAARLTGCKNISRIKRLSPQRLHALDWNLTLRSDRRIPPNTAYVGIHAHAFQPADAPGDNVIPLTPLEVLEGAFEHSLLFQNADAPGSKELCWRCSQQQSLSPPPSYLHIPPDGIILLKDTTWRDTTPANTTSSDAIPGTHEKRSSGGYR